MEGWGSAGEHLAGTLVRLTSLTHHSSRTSISRFLLRQTIPFQISLKYVFIYIRRLQDLPDGS